VAAVEAAHKAAVDGAGVGHQPGSETAQGAAAVAEERTPLAVGRGAVKFVPRGEQTCVC
jgi:hypothetical protein